MAVTLGVVCAVAGSLVVGLTATLTAQTGGQAAWAGTPQQAFYESDIVDKYQCDTCHTIMTRGGTVGPILNHVGHRRTEDWLRRWLTDPNEVKPGTKMPKFPFSDEEYEQTVGYLAALAPERNPDVILSEAGSLKEKGAALFEEYDCYACHRIGSEGRFVGPDLTWLGRRKDRDWERVWLADPDAWKPGTFMPNFELSEPEVEALTAHLEQLNGQRNQESREWEFNVNLFLNNRPSRRGELIFKRTACWSCHGEEGFGGIRNPNAAPNEEMPPLRSAANDFTLEELKALLDEPQESASLNAAAAPPPFACPDYTDVLTDREFEDLYAYFTSIAPRQLGFSFR